ncbi:MAG: GNAT family N-acetyltransferase [SAR86 cluster bacterium]|uniref:GNAT family N-acetyltransferase n=1 Tax=SAR86 cluster bacterium TaxID=2030880 RepID=A0A2A4X832_9GAMM|nr:MAG: GNAT family N-acetyltransferase [SAR86 cluster bacterium]
MQIQIATPQDFDNFWPIFQQIARSGETYAYSTNITKAEARKKWMETPARTYVAKVNGEVLASYYIKTNHEGPGAHVCNCGYMVATSARGKGLATALCEHSQQVALELGYKAMQFNFVASSNESAVKLWQKLGFEIVGRIPAGFEYPEKSFVDAFVMYKWLEPESKPNS